MKQMLFRLTFVICAAFALAAAVPARAQEYDQGKPLDLPVALPAGPSTWLLGQVYGNTTGAFANGTRWYSAGQGLHFGIDLSMACGTPLVAVADGEVKGVDDLGFGSGPHNLILLHEAYGITTLYGHLLDRPPLVNGQRVSRGEIVGYSGDPDSTCDSRPHLHFEVRSLDYRTTYNPVDYISAAWHSLSSVGSFSTQSFQRDLDNPRRWMTLYDQPEVFFGGRRINEYAASWPPLDSPPANPPAARTLDPLPEAVTIHQRRFAHQGCCFWPEWHPTDPTLLRMIDGGEGRRANIFDWRVGEAEPVLTRQAPPPFLSPDGSLEVTTMGDDYVVNNPATGESWLLQTGGEWPAFSPDNARILWLHRDSAQVPGQTPPRLEIRVADARGDNPRVIATQDGGYAVWLDSSRVLAVESANQRSTLRIHNVDDGSVYELGSWMRLRSLSVSPGGTRLMFYSTYNEDPALDGIYTIETQAGASAVQLPWFGAWRWRDNDSVFYIPFNPVDNRMSLAYYHIPTATNRVLATPDQFAFTVANGDWSVSADGQRIAYLNAYDMTTWLLEIVP
jgi:murein DD-endopeptidase MepM/ murein hydrolase activator NlpD